MEISSRYNNNKSKHISISHEYIKKFITSKIIIIIYIKFANNLIDPFIKETITK